MTMTSVVRNYLRWFELNKCMRAIRDGGDFSLRRRLLQGSFSDKEAYPGWTFRSAFSRDGKEGAAIHDRLEADGNERGFADPLDGLQRPRVASEAAAELSSS